jgi:uncharacterized spore protein YtfJ
MSHDLVEVAATLAPEPGFLERMAERLGGQAQAKSVFGEPVTRDGVTVIPVARAAWGFGGGFGHAAAGRDGGSGGGGGVSVRPVGYIELRNGRSRFRPIRDRAMTGSLLLAAGGLALLLARAFRERRSPRERPGR